MYNNMYNVLIWGNSSYFHNNYLCM